MYALSGPSAFSILGARNAQLPRQLKDGRGGLLSRLFAAATSLWGVARKNRASNPPKRKGLAVGLFTLLKFLFKFFYGWQRTFQIFRNGLGQQVVSNGYRFVDVPQRILRNKVFLVFA